MPACAVHLTILRAFSDTEDSHCLSHGRLKFESDNYEANLYKKNQTSELVLDKDRDTYYCDIKIKEMTGI